MRTPIVALVALMTLLAGACGAATQDVVSTGLISEKKPSVSLVGRASVRYVPGPADLVDPAVDEVVELRMSMFEFGYGPRQIEVPVGTTVRFIFENSGSVEHEAIVGDAAVQEAQRSSGDTVATAHDDEPAAAHDDAADPQDGAAPHDEPAVAEPDMAGMDMGEAPADAHGAHGDVPLLVLGPGEAGDLVVTFDEVGEFIIGCHIKGHWEAGMRAAITVV